MLRVLYDDLEIVGFDGGGSKILHYKGDPFTGFVVDYNENSTLAFEAEYKNGHQDGVNRSFYNNGQIEEEYYTKYNRILKHFKRWTSKGRLIKHITFNEEGDIIERLLDLEHELRVLAIDVYYYENKAKAVGVLFGWYDNTPSEMIIEYTDDITEYVPGEFYKRELPCIKKITDRVDLSEVTAIIIDGHIYTDDNHHPGLGFYTWEVLGKEIPVIGVAKKSFHANNKTVKEVLRGESTKPLYVSAIGFDYTNAANYIKKMHGDFRIPTILKELDRITKEEK